MATSRAVRLLELWERHTLLCQSLTTPAMRPFAESPLSRWVRSDDRGIPADLAKRTVGSLLRSDFDELIETPGVGVTKLAKLMELLERVGDPPAIEKSSRSHGKNGVKATTTEPATPDEQWKADVDAIRLAGVEGLPLGRLAPSLDELPRNLWLTPLSRFISLSYGELHSIPYFGTRRIAAVSEIVAQVARQARALRLSDRSTNRPAPALMQVEERLTSAEPLTREAILREILSPLFAQLAVDLGPRAVAVACLAVGLDAATAKDIAGIESIETLSVSRPRTHQIREDIRLALQVRWPGGDKLLEACIVRCGAARESASIREMLGELCSLMSGRRYGRRLGSYASYAVPSLSDAGH